MSVKPRRLPEAGLNRRIEAALRLPMPIPSEIPEVKATTDPFDEIDFGSFFDDYLDPGYKSPASEVIERPSFETFLSSPVTLADYLHSQLSVLVLSEPLRDAAERIIGNLDENGYLHRGAGGAHRDGRDRSPRPRGCPEGGTVARSVGRRRPRRSGMSPAPVGRPQRPRRSGLAASSAIICG